jgi:anti-sigma regulatory factor (Ser/Thr protein kinase)
MTAAASPAVRLVMEADAANVSLARQAALGVCEGLGMGPGASDDVRLAVSEACSNVVLHAYPHGQGSGTMVLEIDSEAGMLVVRVCDRGRGVNGDPGDGHAGLGLPLITMLAQAVEIVEGPDGVGTDVTMTFAVAETGESDAPAGD